MKYPEFINEEKYLSLHNDLSELEILKRFSENLKTIQSLTTKHYLDFDTLISEYLEAGCKIFQMDVGIISRVQGEDYFICDALTADNSIQKGDKFELEGTYCREVIKSNQVLGFPHVGGLKELKDHPVYINMKLESYISAPIRKNDQIFGTLNFSSTNVREFGFSESEKELIALMANAIGAFLLLQEKEQKLEDAIKRIRKLTGFVAHDLRSPLASISSMLEILPELDESERDEFVDAAKVMAKKGMEIVHTILEAAILGDGKISLDKRGVDLKEIFDESLSESKSRISECNLDVEVISENNKLLVNADKERIQQVFTNLITNSIKYSVNGTKVLVHLSRTDSSVTFSISNEIDFSKLKNDKMDVSENGSIGFGLEIIEEVLKLHNSELKVESKEGVYKASFDLESL